ncbi:MAG: protein translocase subunit SecD [Pseudomonadota bacterium]
MLQFNRLQTIAILGTVLLGVLFTIPNFLTSEQLEKAPGFVPSSQVKLGLDLRGGSYLLLKVETDEVIDNRMTSLRREVQREMRPSGNRERIALQALPTYNADTATISLRVREASDVAEAEDRIKALTRQGLGAAVGVGLRPYEVIVTGERIDIRMSREAQTYYIAEAVKDSIEVVRRRIDPVGNKEVSIQPQGADRIIVQAPGDDDPEALKEVINRTGQLTFHHVDGTVDPLDAESGLLPPGRILVPNAEYEGPGAEVLYEEPVITGDMVADATAEPNSETGGFQIGFRFDNTGARRFGDFTRDHVGERFAIVLDNEVISAPRIQSVIPGGTGRITGNFTAEEVTRTATLIRSGALPATLTTIEQRSVGAELGADSVRAGAIALIVGFAGVIIYMVLSYGRFGVYADMALIANVALIAGALSLFGSTLTLPGIAGIVLTIGMAVDANVLIFERIREEVLGGKPPVRAIELGFDKARSAIVDANVTTFAAAAFMFILGAGPVRGFAVTLMIGVVTSVFTAYFLTRLLAGGWVLANRPKTITL